MSTPLPGEIPNVHVRILRAIITPAKDGHYPTTIYLTLDDEFEFAKLPVEIIGEENLNFLAKEGAQPAIRHAYRNHTVVFRAAAFKVE